LIVLTSLILHYTAGELINVLREAKQDVPSDLLAFGTTVKKKEHKL
jgi:ATP-dependent RNA helicase DBP3